MKFKILAGLFVLGFLLPSISAYTYLNIYLDETGNALFLGETNEELDLPNGIKITDGIIQGSTQALTSKTGEVWKFDYSLEGAELYVILPRGAVIKTLSEGEISLEKDKLSIYVQENIQVEYIINEVNETENIWLLIFLVLVFAGVVFYFSRKNKKVEKKPDQTKVIENMLNEREKLILNKLKETGKIKGSRLRKLCDIPKASFSRHVQELEKKKLIKRSGEGKNKFVELKE